jgi:DNA-binding CsgD family transcriptional regulator
MIDVDHTPDPKQASPATLATLASFGRIIAAGAHLPLIPVSDWGNRAAQAMNAAGDARATTVTILDRQTRVVLHVGASCSTTFSELHSRLFSLAASMRYEDDYAPSLLARFVGWGSSQAHPFAEAGFPEGRVIVCGNTSSGPVGVVVRHWYQGEAATEADLRAMDAIVAFLAQAAQHLVPQDTRPIEWLSSKESEVLDLITLGHTVREIAESLGRSPHTIHDHLKSIHRKTGLSTRGALVAAAIGKRHASSTPGPKPEPMHQTPVIQTHPAITLTPPPPQD